MGHLLFCVVKFLLQSANMPFCTMLLLASHSYIDIFVLSGVNGQILAEKKQRLYSSVQAEQPVSKLSMII